MTAWNHQTHKRPPTSAGGSFSAFFLITRTQKRVSSTQQKKVIDMSLTKESTLGELFEMAKKNNGTTIEPNNFDVTIKEMQSELDCVLKMVFDSWYELRVIPIESLRGIPRVRYIASKGNEDVSKA